MVIVNPKLSLPTDLPYKKRQRPFNPNTSLHQATIRYNEALRKQYNDIQFAKRYESGAICQNELTSVNTIDIGKNVDPQLFSEMSDLNPLLNEQVVPHVTRKRKSKKIFICSGSSISDAITSGSSSCDHTSSSGPVSPSSGSVTSQNEDGSGMLANNLNASYDCNNTEMFPQLQATIPIAHTENERPYFSRSCANRQLHQHQPPPPSSNSSLEAQAINEYEPTADSAHDMIFGNVMGLHYGNYIHDHLWTPAANQPQPNHNHPLQNNSHLNNDPTHCHFNMSPQTFQNNLDYQPVSLTPPPPPNNHHPQIHMCSGNKAVGFTLPSTTSGSGLGIPCQNQPNTNPINVISNANSIMLANASNSATTVGNQMNAPGNCYVHAQSANSTRPNNRSRSTSVPRPRVGGARKETLKQAAIRCGIIKGNQTVPAIPKRSLCLVPLQLSAAQSDPAVSVVEILHPRTLIPTCSSEALVDENYAYNKFKLNFNQSHPGDNYVSSTAFMNSNHNNTANNIDHANENDILGAMPSTKENISDEGRLLTQISSISDFRMLEGAMSCASNNI